MDTMQGTGTVIAELDNGQEIKCQTMLTGYGQFRQLQEDRHPDGIGWYETITEVNIDEVEATYPDEYGIAEIEKQEIEIKSIKQVLSDVNWEVII